MSAAVPSGPLESAPGGFVPEEERTVFLAAVLDGVELGAWGRRLAESQRLVARVHISISEPRPPT